jgi:sugar (pentulose or hexulose) kinase
MGEYVIGVDVGTTATKGMLVSRSGEIVRTASRTYELIKPDSVRTEQRAEDWWRTLVEVVRECTSGPDLNKRDQVVALSVSTQGGSMVPVDAHGNPLSNAIVWLDRRGQAQRAHLLSRYDDEFFYRKTGFHLGTGLNLVAIAWVRDNDKELFQRTHKFLSTQDYLNLHLTGTPAIDYTNAAMTQLMDVASGEWDEALLEAAGIGQERLASILQAGALVGSLTTTASEQLGLSTSVQVYNGAHDQYCAAVGSGTFELGDLMLSTGTAWVILGVFDGPVYDAEAGVAPRRHVVTGLWGSLASLPTAGLSMEWFRYGFAQRRETAEGVVIESFADIDRQAATRMKKAGSVLVYPYLRGSTFPTRSSDVRACIMGLGLEHDRYDIALATMECVAFEARRLIERFQQLGCSRSVRVLGGAARSDLWAGIIAHVTGGRVIRLKQADAACLGAAIIAGSESGVFSSYQHGYSQMSPGDVAMELDPVRVEHYELKYQRYLDGIPAIHRFYERS